MVLQLFVFFPKGGPKPYGNPLAEPYELVCHSSGEAKVPPPKSNSKTVQETQKRSNRQVRQNEALSPEHRKGCSTIPWEQPATEACENMGQGSIHHQMDAQNQPIQRNSAWHIQTPWKEHILSWRKRFQKPALWPTPLGNPCQLALTYPQFPLIPAKATTSLPIIGKSSKKRT